jgi:predicted Fe-Mo cluster-binding NifX family protein
MIGTTPQKVALEGVHKSIYFCRKMVMGFTEYNRRHTMKIAVSSTGQTLDSAVEVRFGRCPYFLIVNPATLDFDVIANANAELEGGVGIQSAQLIVEKSASVVLTGSCGPNALQVLKKAGIHVITGVSGSVSQVVQQFTAGSLKSGPSVQTSPRFSGRKSLGMGGGRGTGSSGRSR